MQASGNHPREGSIDDSRRLIVVRLMGGLGNQMFQYAMGRALALRSGASLKLDLSHYTVDRRRHYALGCFSIEAPPALDRDLARFGLSGKILPGRLDRIRRMVRARLAPADQPIIRERGCRFDPVILQLQGAAYLEGYWQSEKYFLDQTDIVRREFTGDGLDPDNARVANQIDAVNAVSVHVRRGDYVGDATANRYHGTCSLDYYRAAIDYVVARTPSPHLFIFSDEPAWVRTHFPRELPSSIVDINPPERGYRDMQLMARCRHHIIANSSFSWWGAWLAAAPGKIVVAPRRWFNVDSIDTRDLVPDDWVRL
jgi:hypothetical protein